MVHCLTQQQPIEKTSTGSFNLENPAPEIVFNYPNPFDQLTTIEINIDLNYSGTLEIYNGLGQMVKTVDTSRDTHELDVSMEDFESGIYFYCLKVKGKVIGRNKMIVNK